MAAAKAATPTLGASLATGLPLLTELILKETDATRRKDLRKVQKVLARHLRRLVEKNVNRATQDYKKATKALAAANAAIKEAKKDLAKVAKTIEKLAKAADFVGKVAAAAT